MGQLSDEGREAASCAYAELFAVISGVVVKSVKSICVKKFFPLCLVNDAPYSGNFDKIEKEK